MMFANTFCIFKTTAFQSAQSFYACMYKYRLLYSLFVSLSLSENLARLNYNRIEASLNPLFSSRHYRYLKMEAFTGKALYDRIQAQPTVTCLCLDQSNFSVVKTMNLDPNR